MVSAYIGDPLTPLTLERGARAPHLAEIRDYLRFVAKLSKARLHKGKKVTVRSLVVNAEWFFAGFARITGNRHSGWNAPAANKGRDKDNIRRRD